MDLLTLLALFSLSLTAVLLLLHVCGYLIR